MAGVLLHSPADILRQLLIDLELGTAYVDDATSWAVFASGEADMPDDCITVYDTEGRNHGREMVHGERQEHHGFQVRVRARNHAVGYLKARDIAVKLDQEVYQELVTVEEIQYLVHAVTRVGDVLPIGKDAPRSKRSLFTINGIVSLRVKTDIGALLQYDEDGLAILCEDDVPLLVEIGETIL